MHPDIELTLGRNLIEATTAGIALYIDHTKTVAGILTDTLERGKQTGFDLCLEVLHLLLQLLFLSTCLSHNLIQLCVLDPKGNVLENRSLNVIEQASGSKPKKTDYAKLLESRELQRMAERKSWESVEGIKQLKDGYIGQVVRILADLMLKYDAVIAIEDMSLGFKQQRQKIEKAVSLSQFLFYTFSVDNPGF